MNKTYCDACKKEINQGNEYCCGVSVSEDYPVIPVNENRFDYSFSRYDLCKDCAEKFKETMKKFTE